ncbi:MAG TPA: HAMP domain-containing sensor histidine kinase [Gaiellaceae bacterium]|nr:HAMP domain-containing sensor histidine kinase [Gaiellaceae bacterium]
MRKVFAGVGTRLVLALLAVLAGAFALVYLIVVPSLEDRLVASRLRALERAAPGIARELPADRFRWPDFIEAASASANARVVVYDTVGPPTALVVAGDSQGFRSSDVERDALALRAAVRRVAAAGTTTRDGERYAEAAAPVPGSSTVVLVSSSLHEAFATARVARERLLVAGGLALVVALAVGYAGAWLFARRLRRLEAAAERISAGRFDEPITDTGADEVGELARAFDRMRQRLAQLDHARGEFIANASHELRTPVFALGGFLELLLDEDLDDGTRREFLATMSEQVDRLAKLATELLDLSRADAGRLQVDREPLDLGEVARTVADEFAARAVAGRRPLDADSSGSAWVSGDEQRVLQIARALVENALVHTPEGTQVRVRAANGTLEVEDDGPGIPPEHAEHVFGRFYRGDGPRASGSGLGLAIARELAIAMGGTIDLESRPGRTVFTLSLPVAEPASVPHPVAG